MQAFWIWIKEIGNKYFHKIKNEKIKANLLQALPFWVASVVTGLIAVIYSKLFFLAEAGSHFLFQHYHWLPFFVTPICFFTAVWVVNRFAPFAKGSGIPQVTAAIELANPKSHDRVNQLLSIRVILTKIISSAILALGGGIIGREGPTIQIAGSIFRKINQWLPDWWPKISKRNMIMTGAAAGLAAAFNTPLGGIVFAMEELTKTHISFYKTAIFSAVIIAGITAQAFLGPYLYLGYPDVSHLSTLIFLGTLLVSVIAGLAASIMCKLMLKLIKWKSNFIKRWKRWAYILVCSLVVAMMAIYTNQEYLNSGKELMSRILFSTDKFVHWYTPIIRILGSIVSFTSGAAGGVFAPALASGASIGSAISGLLSLSASNTNLLILAGMVAFLTGVTRSPFTSAILVLEMTEGHHIIFHLMLAALTANLMAHFIDKKSFYDHLKDQYIHALE